MCKINVFYLLSEAGRKENIKNGRDGLHLQCLSLTSTPELLKVATVAEDGSVYIGLNVQVGIANDSCCNCENCAEHCIQYECDSDNKKFTIMPFAITNYILDNVGGDIKIIEVKERIEYPNFLTEETVMEEIGKFEKQQKKLAKIEKALNKQRKEIEEQRKQIEVEFNEEMKKWIEENGSEHLQLSYKLNYGCTELYVKERAKDECPGYTVQLEEYLEVPNSLLSKNPSFEHLKEVSNLIDHGVNAKIITIAQHQEEQEIQEEQSIQENQNMKFKDAIIITGYLGKYSLIKY